MASPRPYSEATEQPPIEALPLSHLSIEVGHFSLYDLVESPQRVADEFRRMVPLVAAFGESARVRFGPEVRISTCYLLDDYFQHDVEPPRAIGPLLAAAAESGLRIDYLARESGCGQAAVFVDGVPLGDPIPVAEMVAARIVAEPAPPDTGRRPPTSESGWLCNGRRSSDDELTQAMRPRVYQPPEQFGKYEHSIFLDVELWSTEQQDGTAVTRWSCPFLASVWHLLRLGMLRYRGAAVVDPQPWRPGDSWPDRWSELPPVVQLNPAAEPFAAYQTLSILPKRYIDIEHAVRVILDHLDLDDDVMALTAKRGAKDVVPVQVPPRVSERLSHLLLDGA